MKKTIKNFSKILLISTVTLLTFTSCTKENFPVLIGGVPVAPTSVTDIDGNTYPIAEICGKFWMTENLRTTRYNDGTIIPVGLSNTAWGASTTGACAFYDNLATNNVTYGKLYNWFAASNLRLAPVGWHVATEAEWTALIECLGGSNVAGGKMKSTSSLWSTPNLGADNSSGFNALPSGWKAGGGGYALLGDATYFWSSSERNTTQGEYVLLNTTSAATASNGATKTFGYSVRCVKD